MYGRVILMTCLSTTLASCAFLKGLGQDLNQADNASINKAVGEKDAVYLDKVCKGEIGAKTPHDRDYACNRAEWLRQSEAGPREVLEADCATVIARFDANPHQNLEYMKQVGVKFAGCGFTDAIFERLAHWGNANEGVQILNHVESGGVALVKAWGTYLASHKGPKFFAVSESNAVKYGLDYIGKWLVGANHLEHCPALAASATGASEMARVWSLPYLRKSACKEASAIGVSVLTSDDAQHRVWACDALGDMGDKAALAKVQILAETDGFSQVREVERDGRIWAVNEFPVRDACTQAAGKIRLRI